MPLKSVLIVSPHFPPINAPDHQRVRMALPYFREFGWEPVVLAVDPEFSENLLDDSLLATVPENIEVHRVPAVRSSLTRRVGLGSLALRSLPYLRARGNEILSSRKFDLVFFSTSLFPVMSLGPGWHNRFGVPYVLDLQDPWLSDYYDNSSLRPPGGKLKYHISQAIGRALEPRTVRNAAHIVVVSPAYPALLRERYSDLNGKPFTVLPFAAAERDLELANSLMLNHRVFDSDGLTHWVYAGAAGLFMEKSIRAFFIALKAELNRDPGIAQRLRIHFVGTDYASGTRARKTFEPIAEQYGLTELVQESTERLPFLTTLKLLSDADALLIFGSDDPTYTASKIFPYVLARKPLLVIVHQNSSVVDIVERTGAATLITFSTGEAIGAIAGRIVNKWFERPGAQPETDWKEFDCFTARSMSKSLSKVFSQAIEFASTPLAVTKVS